ncbi:MAG: tetratricopeptide repeat protein, partial [Candidatus Omnitrophica bacterium]|nr:tetratricopeptide repeat protein [Candidatus Omnitrophota bacterium]
GIFIPEALSVPLYAGGFFALWLFEEKPTLRRGALVGLVLGLATLTKAGLILFTVAFSVFRWIRPAQAGPGPRKAVLALLAAFFMTLSPVTLHNVVFGKDLVWLTSHAGFNFYVGNNPRSEGVFVAPEGTGNNVDSQIRDSKAVAERELDRALRPSEVSRYWSDKAWVFIRENPQAFLRLCGRKLLIFFDSREISDVDDYQFLKGFIPFLNFPWLDFSVLGPLAFLGLWLSVRRTRQAPLIYFWVGSYLVGLAAFFVNARYRLPLLGVFFPIAALGLMDLFEALRRREAVKIGLCALALGAGIWLGQMKLVGTDWSRDYVNAGDVYLEKNDFEKARGFYDEALRIDPRSAKAHLAMGILFSKQGRQEEAKGYYLKAIEEDPRNAQAFNNLGFWYDKEGDLETARSYFLKALELNPSSSYAHNNLGMIYGKSGDNEKAVKEFEASLKINPRSARAYTNLGLVQYRLGRVEEARASWRKALEVDPGFAEARRALSAIQNTPISFDTT